MSDPDAPETGARPGYKRLRQQCPTCNGRGTVVTPVAGIDADGKAGTVGMGRACSDCVDGWIDRGWVPVS